MNKIYKLDERFNIDKCFELEANFNIYQDIIQVIKHNNFKRFEETVKNI